MQISYNVLQKKLEEANKHFEEEFVETRTQFEQMTNQLEHSRENNDLLKRMSKIIVDKFENKNGNIEVRPASTNKETN